jgi:hypothetical protein
VPNALCEGSAKLVVFAGFSYKAEKCVFCAKRSLTGTRHAHRNRAFRRDLERFRPAFDGLRLVARGLRDFCLSAALFDIVILEKGNAGGGVLAGEPAMVRQSDADGMRFLEL